MAQFLELIDYIAVGVALGLGLVVGRRMRPKPPEPLTPMCTCKHGWGKHEDGGRCHGQVQQETYFAGYSSGARRYRWVTCPCMRYDGPSMEILGRFLS